MRCNLNPPDTQPGDSFQGFRKQRRNSSRHSRKNPLNPSTFFSFQRNIIQRCSLRALPSRRGVRFEPSQKSTPGIFISLQNVPSNSSYEGRVHWALSPSSVQVPAIFQLMYFSRQRHPNQQSFGALGFFFLPAKIACQYVHYLLPTKPLGLFWPANNFLGCEDTRFSCNLKQISIKLNHAA